MRGSDLLEKLSLVDEAYVTAADAVRPRRRRGGIYALAACLCLLVCAGALFAVLRGGTPSIIDEDGFYIENGVLLHYSGIDTDIVLPTAVKSVADYAFKDNVNASAISTVTIGASVERVGTNAFAGLENLTRLILEDESTAFVERDGGIFTFDGSMLVRFENAETTEYTLPDGVRYIAAHAFQSSKLEKITFCDTLEYIGFNAFAGCALTAISLPESIVRVEEGAFASCTKAVDGYIPQHTELGRNAFEGVPFFLSQIAGHISPLEQIVRGEISPAEAIALSDRAYLLGQLDAILAYYRDGTVPSGEYARLAYIVGAALPEGAVLPDAADFSALALRDNGWGCTGIYDIQLRLPLGGDVTMVAEAYLYGGALDLLDWDNAPWRIETVLFVTKSARDAENYGAWAVTRDERTLVFRNTETDAVARAELPVAGDFTYELLFSPDGNRVVIEYRQTADWLFRIQSLDGEVFEPSMNTYADYMSRYFGKYTHGTLSWKDNDTVAGENEYGMFEFDPHVLYPRQVTDYRRDFREDVLVDRALLTAYDSDEITKYVITLPETWVGDNYLEDIRRMETSPGNATRMTGGALYDLYGRPSDLYRDGKWDVNALSLRGMMTYEGETVENNEQRIILHGKYAELEETWYSAAMLVDRKVLICNFTVYPDDPADYYTRVILPVIESFRVESTPNYFGFDMRAAKNGEEQLITFESLRYANGKTLLTLKGENGNTLVLDATAAFPYDAAREGERLLYGDIGGGYFWINADTHLHFGGGTEEVPLADGETIDLGDVSALWD